MKRLNKCILLLFITLILGISTATAFEVSPANPTVGDEITIRGTGSGDSIDASVAFTKNVGVANGEYEYSINGVDIPGGDNRFTVRAEGVQDLNVRVKILSLFPFTKSADASGGVATVSQSNVPSGNYNIKIDGNAASGQSDVDLTITATQTMDITNGQFEETYSTSSIPEGDFRVTVAGDTKTITLSSTDSSTSSGSSASSSNTGGGEDTTPDKANGNVDFSESITKRVFSEMPVKYQFSHSSMPIRSINITSRITAMDIPINVEVLDDTSVMVKNKPKGKIYKHLNIWVGSTGFAVPENINSATIHFRVDNDWIHNNDIDPSTIVLMHYEEEAEEWTELPTYQTSSNKDHTYYRATTPHFSPFAISGEIEQIPTNTSENISTAEHPQNTTTNHSNSMNSTHNGETGNDNIYGNIWIFVLLITALLGIILLKLRNAGNK